jgi:hypothetical protein
MSDVEILGRPKYRSIKERLIENFSQKNKKSQSEGKGSSCDPELVYQRDVSEKKHQNYEDY